MWYNVNHKDVCLPSVKANKKILVTDGTNVSIVTVSNFLDNVDKPWNTWTYWTHIPDLSITDDE